MYFTGKGTPVYTASIELIGGKVIFFLLDEVVFRDAYTLKGRKLIPVP